MTIADEKSAQLLELEETLEAQVTASMRKILAQMLAQLDALWPGDDAPLIEKRKALSRIKISRLDTASERIVSDIRDGMYAALYAGWKAGIVESALPAPEMTVTVPKHVMKAVKSVPDKVREKTILARAALRVATTKDEAQAAIVLAGQSITAVRQATTYAVNAASNVGLEAVAASRPELIAIWHPERDACVRCLNRAGEIDPDEIPPEHPFCRCKLWVLERESGARVAKGLKREAERSILRGWSRPSESQSVRIEAARKLLARGTDLPKSVQAYARRAIKDGEFPRGRKFPG